MLSRGSTSRPEHADVRPAEKRRHSLREVSSLALDPFLPLASPAQASAVDAIAFSSVRHRPELGAWDPADQI